MYIQHKKSLTVSFIVIVTVVCLCFGISAGLHPWRPLAVNAIAEIEIAPGAFGQFGATGIYIKKPTSPIETNILLGGIEIPATQIDEWDNTNDVEFYPYIKNEEGYWDRVPNTPHLSDFWITPNPSNRGVNWYLRETALTKSYSVLCVYDDVQKQIYYSRRYQIIYTDGWTFVSVNNTDGENRTSFSAETSQLSLALLIGHDGGATVGGEALENPPPHQTFLNGMVVGGISSNQIIDITTLRVRIDSLWGAPYGGNILRTPVTEGNLMTLRFTEPLGERIYILTVYNEIDGLVYGKFIIDNTGPPPFSMGDAWFIFVILGSLMILTGVMLYFIPVYVRKRNANKIYAENQRIARLKNPELFVNEEKKKPFGKKPDKKKKPDAVAEEDKPAAEPTMAERKPAPEGRVRFTEQLQANREQRQFMADNNITQEMMNKIKREEEELKQAEQDSFAFLRGDSSPIGTLHEEKPEDVTIETDSVVQDGVRFSNLDSDSNG